MKTLHLLRHAKSSWDHPELADHDRPLAPRGANAVQRMAAYLAGADVAPAVVLCSTALRARDTLDGVRASLGDAVEVRMEDELYGADARELLDRLRRLPPALPSAMVIGHNPTLQDLALDLAGRGDREALARLHQKFPTGALATLLIEGEWATLGAGTATLAALVVPRELSSG